MNRIFFTFFIVFLGSIIFPLKSLGAGTYEACPRDYPVYYKISDTVSVCCSKDEVKAAKKNRLSTCVSPVPAGSVAPNRDRMTVCYEGLVPCGLGQTIWEGGEIKNGKCATTTGGKIISGTSEGISCQFCHFFVIMNGVVSFVLISIVPYLAVLMLVVGGSMFYFAGGAPGLLTRGQNLIKNVVIGLFLIYGSYMLVGYFLAAMGVVNVNLEQWANQGAFSINCVIR